MTKQDYIEKITQNLEHLTKDELKDVSILTTAQLGVRQKFAERQQIEHEIANLTPQLQQQALPVVPECVADYIEECKEDGDCLFGIFADASRVEYDMPDLVYFWLGDEGDNDELFARAWLDGYTVEKPQLFYLKNKITGNVLVYDESPELSEVSELFATGGEFELENYTFTQQEIDNMQTGSYEQIEVTE